ncbi:hypothetical protein TTRE_0000464801 [Trichuris trichiura]|uniref:Uncharacterized protein n=1 Tax=Trichuris trichiura TaxID=36087 RepID=A0A077Z825_TRITR|nr:hypothetical protein TTRE_0000464801 [Trichuris trichiura]
MTDRTCGILRGIAVPEGQLTYFPSLGKPGLGGGISVSLLTPQSLSEALPTVRMRVEGAQRDILVGTGCSKCVAHASCREGWRGARINLTKMDGMEFRCEGTGFVRLQLAGRNPVEVKATLAETELLWFDFKLGMNVWQCWPVIRAPQSAAG